MFWQQLGGWGVLGAVTVDTLGQHVPPRKVSAHGATRRVVQAQHTAVILVVGWLLACSVANPHI